MEGAGMMPQQTYRRWKGLPIFGAARRLTNDEIAIKSDALLTKSDEIPPKMTIYFVITDESVTKFHEGNDEMDTRLTK